MSTLVRANDSIPLSDHLPVVALRDLVYFPYMVLPLLVGRPPSVAALEEAEGGDRLLLALAQRRAEDDQPRPDDLHPVGTVVRVLQSSVLPDGTRRVVFEGLGRARAAAFQAPGPDLVGARPLVASAEPYWSRECDDPEKPPAPETEALVRRVRKAFAEYAELHSDISRELLDNLDEVSDTVRLLHLLAGHIIAPASEKQGILEATSVSAMADAVGSLLDRELEILRIEQKIDQEMHRQMDSDRRQLYLEEQLKAIRKELGSEDGEWSELEKALEKAELPDHALERAEQELGRLRRLNPAAPEAGVIRGYLEWILSLPWDERTPDNLDVTHAEAVLEEDHHGLREVKDRILDHIAVLSLVGELQGPILCLAGPPGVGKTSLGRSIARVLGRRFFRISLGGIRDEAEIRGHRRTYVGALPGRIIQGLRRAGTRNPVLLLDEVDKVARDVHGDPAAALLEVLDPEQNREFTDHYLELGFDLSDVLFVATANTLAGIPGPLQDRMEVIRIPGYLDTEKRSIARRFLLPRQLSRNGLAPEQIRLSPEALEAMVHRYTREAGVRDLERQISRMSRKVARRVAAGELGRDETLSVGLDELRTFLGPAPRPRDPREAEERGRVGIANGLAWTPSGGEVLDVEVAVVPGKGKLELTGALGAIMKESAWAALTFARSRARSIGLDPDFHREVDLHIHLPEGATPKDGPSAGITIAVALISALTGIPTRSNVAMTGEITLRGRVLGVGGIREKAVAALRSDITRILLPASNEDDLEKLPEEVRDRIRFVPLTSMDDVFREALVRTPWADSPDGDAPGAGAAGDDRPRPEVPRATSEPSLPAGELAGSGGERGEREVEAR